MIRRTSEYVLALCILLLNGYSNAKGISNQDQTTHFQAKVPAESEYVNSCSHLAHSSENCQFTEAGPKGIVKVYTGEKEEEPCRQFSPKTYTGFSDNLEIFSKESFFNFPSDLTVKLPAFTHWFYSSSQRYNVLRVLRI